MKINRRYPITSKLAILIKIFDLSPEDQDFLYDLAGKARNEVSPDLLQYVMVLEIPPYVRTAIRKSKQYTATIKDWKGLSKDSNEI